MKRTAGNRAARRPKPVQRIDLNERHLKLRWVLLVVVLLIGGTALIYGLTHSLTAEAGWRVIDSDGSAGLTCAGDFVFQYQLGASGASAAAELKELTSLYTEAAATAYRLFDAKDEYQGVVNLATINRHPGEPLEVGETLYRALSECLADGARYLYLGPLYQDDWALAHSADDREAAEYDPGRNEAVRAYRAVAAAWIGDGDEITLSLLPDRRVRLDISEGYLAFAEDAGITEFIDFGWMKNAFIADYLAERIGSRGFMHGTISSYDGFIRNLDTGEYAVNLYDRQNSRPYQVGVLRYDAPGSLVTLRAFPVDSAHEQWFYTWADGAVRTPHLDPADGKPKDAWRYVTVLSDKLGCGALLMKLMPVYIADRADEADLLNLAQDGTALAWPGGEGLEVSAVGDISLTVQ